LSFDRVFYRSNVQQLVKVRLEATLESVFACLGAVPGGREPVR
jgi:hypothetical protein